MNRIVVSGPPVAVIRITSRGDGLHYALLCRRLLRRRSLDHVRVENAILFKIMRNGVLSEQWRLQPDLGADPFALRVRDIGWMLASTAAAELRSEASTLNLIELPKLAPRFIADGPGNIDF